MRPGTTSVHYDNDRAVFLAVHCQSCYIKQISLLHFLSRSSQGVLLKII